MNASSGFVPFDSAQPNSVMKQLHVVHRDGLITWREHQPPWIKQWLASQNYDASPGSMLTLPGHDGALAGAVIGIGDALDPLSYAHAPYALPLGEWQLASEIDAAAYRALQLGWGLGAYRFTHYRDAPRLPARLALATPDEETRDILAACLRVRNLINTPTQEMGPQQLEDAVHDVAYAYGARFATTVGDELLERNFPAIHAVGRASHRAPRLLELRWSPNAADEAAYPHLAIVGKGVCFDTGGLNLKVSEGMRNMKKDMGGAAHALALAELIMARRLPIRVTLLIPAVENAIGPDAFRPGDIISTRKGVTVEIDNTDAEGRVVLGDALTYASEQAPDMILDFATLTGAARVALGPDLPALYSNDDALAESWLNAAAQVRDPVWRMPLWRPYLRYLTSNIADLANAGPSKMAGSITAALYLERFVPADTPWAHLDVYSWNDGDRPGKPTGGEAQGLRAVFAMLQTRYAS